MEKDEFNITLSAEAYAKLKEYADMRKLTLNAAVIDMADKAGRLVRNQAKMQKAAEEKKHEEANAASVVNEEVNNPYINYKVFLGYPAGTPFFTIMWDFVDVNRKYEELSKRYGGPLDSTTGRRHIICTFKKQFSYENKYISIQIIFTGQNNHPVFGIEVWENGLKANTDVFDSLMDTIIVYKHMIDSIINFQTT